MLAKEGVRFVGSKNAQKLSNRKSDKTTHKHPPVFGPASDKSKKKSDDENSPDFALTCAVDPCCLFEF